MANKRHKPEEIVQKLRRVEVLCGQGMPRVDAIRQVQITEQTFYRWRKQYGGMGIDQMKELKRLQKENERLRRAVSDLALDRLLLKEAARGNYLAPLVARRALNTCEVSSKYPNAEPAGCWGSIVRHRGVSREAVRMRSGWWPI